MALLVALCTGSIEAKELILTVGAGTQPHADQHNRSVGVDFGFYRYERSPRQHLQIGVSYTMVHTDTDEHSKLWAVSVYPQLSLHPEADGRFRKLFPGWASPHFFVRALGPSYLSEKQLGEREKILLKRRW